MINKPTFLSGPKRPLARPIFTIESLEDRSVPATLTVNAFGAGSDIAFGDDDILTLREAIAYVNAGTNGGADATQISGAFGNDVIEFAQTGNGQTIFLGGTGAYEAYVNITRDVTIDASALENGVTFDGENNNQIFRVGGETSTVAVDLSLNNVTLANGLAEDDDGLTDGGALFFNSTGFLEIRDSVFSGNEAENRGGAIYQRYGSFTIIDSVFELNDAADQGGGLWADNISPSSVTGSTFDDNLASGGAGLTVEGNLDVSYSSFTNSRTSQYAVVSHSFGTATFDHVTISDNNVLGGSGAGLFFRSSTATISNSEIVRNTGAQRGGGIFSYIGGSVTIENTTIANNDASTGGGIASISGDITIINSTVNDNQANLDGGGIYNLDTLTVVNSTISGNTAGADGGGIIVDGAGYSALIINSTITNNSADTGGGVSSEGTVTIDNSIIAGNSSTSGVAPDINDIDDTNGFLIIGDDTDTIIGAVTGTGTPIILDDEGLTIGDVLAPLSNNGGPTQTHALVAGSVAIDAGFDDDANDPLGNPLTLDQRGVTRILGDFVDLGAVEFAQGLIITSPEDGIFSETPFAVSLDNVFDVDASPDINSIEESLNITNGTLSDFIDNGDGTASFTVTPTGTGDVLVQAYDDAITIVTPSETVTVTGSFMSDVGPETFQAFQVIATPDDGTFTLDDITATNAYVRTLVDNGDGSFTFTVAPNGIGTVEITALGVEGMVTTEFVALTYGTTQTDFISNLYQRLFDRTPSQDEVDYWLGEMENGLIIKEVIAHFFASDEFTAGLSNEGIVNSIYQILFGRDAETDFWTNQLDDGTDVFTVALGILNSDETNDRFAEETYNLEVRRPSDTTGLEFWSDQLALGATIEQIQQGMANTEEGQQVAMET